MPFCPECQAEYEPGITECADCNVALVDTLPEADLGNYQELYACFDPLEAERIEGLLEAEGINALVRDLRSSSFPTDIGRQAAKRIAVTEAKIEEARALIKTAIVDGEISPDGRFL